MNRKTPTTRTAGWRPRPLLAALLSLGLAFPLAPTVAAQAAQGGAAGATSVTQVARAQLAAVAALLEPSEYDFDELGLELAFEDPEGIAAWVRDELRYEVYRGLLRGPQGTLVAKAGNALDQAVLLARLLGDAGFDARVALGELSDADSLTLVLSMFEPGDEQAAPAVAPAAASARVSGLAAATGTDERSIRAVLERAGAVELEGLPAYRDALAQSQALLAALAGPAERDATAELLAEAKEYAWVEYRLGEGDDWTALHPVWPDGMAPTELEAAAVLDSEVPAELMHHLRIEVTIERKRGNEFETEPLMTPWQRPVANLLGVSLVVGNTVLGAGGAGDLASLGSDVIDASFYAPVLNGALAPGAQAFDLKGNLVPPDVAMSGMAGVFQTGASRLGDAAGALGAMGGDEPAEEVFALTAQWIDFVLVAPGGEETRHRRVVFDRRAPQARAAGTGELLDESVLLENLISTYVLMATGGGVSPAFIASQLQEQAEFHLDVIDTLAAQGAAGTSGDAGTSSAAGTSGDEAEALFAAVADYVPKDHLKLFAASDTVHQALPGVAYRAEPSLVALVGTVTPSSEVRATSGVDIIANAKRILRQVDGGIDHDIEAGVLAGVWDTVVEREFVEGTGASASNAVGTARPTTWTLLTGVEPVDAARAGVPLHALTAVRHDLANGYAVMLPATTSPAAEVEASPDWAYWRVDLATGETLGMSSAGRGGAMAEFVVGLKIGLALNAVLAVPGIMTCIASGSPWLCYCDVIATGVLLSFAGALFGALALGEAAMVAYAVVDVGAVGAITTVLEFPTCSIYAGRPEVGARALTGGPAVCWAA